VLIIIFEEAGDTQPAAFVTVKLNVPAVKADIVVLAPVPAIAPGLTVQLPAGNPLRTTLPEARAQVGWVIVPATGAAGVEGCGLMTTLAVGDEEQPAALVTV
jgi:hypothetical protein